jgi:hypothetical protein
MAIRLSDIPDTTPQEQHTRLSDIQPTDDEVKLEMTNLTQNPFHPTDVFGPVATVVRTAPSVISGFEKGSMGLLKTLGSIGNYIADMAVGPETGTPDQVAQKFKEQWQNVLIDKISKNADYWDAKSQANHTDAITEAVGQAVGSLPPALVEWVGNVPFSGLKGMAEAEQAGGDFTAQLKQGGVEAVKRATLGLVFHGLGKIGNPLLRRGGGAVVMGGTAVAEGERDPTKILASTLMGGVLTGKSPERPTIAQVESKPAEGGYVAPQRDLSNVDLSKAPTGKAEGMVAQLGLKQEQIIQRPIIQEAVESGKMKPEDVDMVTPYKGEEWADKFIADVEQAKSGVAPEVKSVEMTPEKQAAIAQHNKAVSDWIDAGKKPEDKPVEPAILQDAGIPEQVQTVSKVEKPTLETIGAKAVANIEEAKKLTSDVREPAVKKLRSEQAGGAWDILEEGLQKGTSPTQAIQEARIGLKKTADVPEVPSPNFSKEEMDIISNKILETHTDFFKVTNSLKAFEDWNAGKILTRSQFPYIEDILGKDVATELYKTHEAAKPAPFTVSDAIDTASSVGKLFTSFDVQAARQLSTTTLLHPIRFLRAVGVNVRAYVDNAYANRIEARTKSSPYYSDATDAGLARLTNAPYSEGGPEQFALNRPFVHRLLQAGLKGGPIGKAVKSPLRGLGHWLIGSERGWVVAHGSFTQGLYDSAMAGWEKAGLPVTPKLRAEFEARAKAGDATAKEALEMALEYRQNRASVINTLVKTLQAKTVSGRELQRQASRVLFSPSMTVARYKIYSDFVTKSGSRGYVAAAIASNISKIIMISALTSLTGKYLASKFDWAKDEDGNPRIKSDSNPLSSMWGKSIVNGVSYDIGGGDTQFYRFMAQLIKGKTKNQAGEIKRVPRQDIVMQYLKGRANPVINFISRMWTGTDFRGNDIWKMPDMEEYSAGNKGPLGKPFAAWMGNEETRTKADEIAYYTMREAAIAVMPTFVQAAWESAIDQGWASAGSRGAMELMSQATNEVKEYASTLLIKERNNSAQNEYGTNWENLSEGQQKGLMADNPNIKEFETKAKAESSSYDYLPETLKQQDAIGEKVQGSLDPLIKKELRGLSVKVGGLSKSFGQWKLNDERYQQYQDYLTEELNSRLGEIVNDYEWSKMDDTDKQITLNTQIGIAKETARNRVRSEANE